MFVASPLKLLLGISFRRHYSTKENLFSFSKNNFTKTSGIYSFPKQYLSTFNMVEQTHFNDFFLSNSVVNNEQPDYFYYLLIVNSDSFSTKLTKSIWDKCKTKVCADGGANRLYDSLTETERLAYIPQFIVGDLDSVREEVVSFYTSHGTMTKEVANQDENDLDKSILLIRSLIETGGVGYAESQWAGDSISAKATEETTAVRTPPNPTSFPGNSCVVIMGGFGNRFDQEMACVSSLFRWQGVFDRMLMVGRDATAELLQPGTLHRIRCINDIHFTEEEQQQYQLGQTDGVREGPTCGLIPLGGRVNNISTTGLQWDLTHGSLEMGVCVSSSNRILPQAPEVTVQTSESVVWTVQLHGA